MNPPACTMSLQTSSPAMRRRSWQRGGAVLAVMAGLLVVAASTLAIRMARQVQDKTGQQQLTQQRMERVAKSLEAYWVMHGCTLPNGAPGASKTGDGTGGTTVPWRTLGIPQADALDAWGRKFSYKKTGTVEVFGGTPETFHWALISHGATGFGAWLVSEPTDQQLQAPVNLDEIANANLNTPLKVRQERTGGDVLPVNLFDDYLFWGSLEKNLCITVKLNSARLDSITQVAYTDRNSNTASITFDSATSWGVMNVASTGGNISRNADGTGIGVCSGLCDTDANSALDNSKTLSFKLSGGKTADKFALGVLSLDPTVEVSITYIKNSPPMPPTNLGTVDFPIPPASPLGAPPGVIAVFENTQPNPPAAFDEVVIRPKGTSRFFIASIRFCTAAENCN